MFLIMVSVLVERNPEEKSNTKLQVASACVCRLLIALLGKCLLKKKGNYILYILSCDC